MRGQIQPTAPHSYDLLLVLWSGLRPARSVAQPTQYALHPSEHLAGIERLGHVIVRAHLQTDDAVKGLAGSRKHDDSDAVRAAELACQREPVLARQVQVHQHDIDPTLRHDFSHAIAIAGDKHIKATELQVFLESLADLRLIIDDEYTAFVTRHSRVLILCVQAACVRSPLASSTEKFSAGPLASTG